MRTRTIVGITIAVVVVIVIGAGAIWFFTSISAHRNECNKLYFEIQRQKSSLSGQLLNYQGLNEMVDSYNSNCT